LKIKPINLLHELEFDVNESKPNTGKSRKNSCRSANKTLKLRFDS